jgi:hypothetical protein
MKAPRPLEKDIQNSICEYLALKKYFFWRQNNTPIMAKGVFRAMPKYSKRGVPDIILVKDGKFIGIEVKRPKEKQNPSQIQFQKDVEQAGARYIVAYSLDDVLQAHL